MREENKKLVKDLLDHSSSFAEDIFDDSQEMLGLVPFILNTMAKRPAFLIFSSLKDFYALRPKSFDAKTAELLAIAAAASAGADNCLKVHMQAAERAGAKQRRDSGCCIHRCSHRPVEGACLFAQGFSGI